MSDPAIVDHEGEQKEEMLRSLSRHSTDPLDGRDVKVNRSQSEASLSDNEPEFTESIDQANSSDSIVSGVQLIPAESIQRVTKGVTLICPFRGPLHGMLLLTTYRLVFVADDKQVAYVSLPFCTIHNIEKTGRGSSKHEYTYVLEVTSKDMRSLRFAFKQERQTRKRLYDLLSILAFPVSSGRPLFCFEYRLQVCEDRGWSIFDMKTELQRLGVPNSQWRLTTANQNYELCESYPSVLAVPASLTDKHLTSVASFRSRGRLPALSWLHPETKVSLLRCSQPLVGTLTKHNHDDELYVRLISESNSLAAKVVIVDARPKRNAVANMALGGGYESDEQYPGTDLIFADIGNIHVMRDSLRKVRDICFTAVEDSSWLSNLESTHWLEHVKQVLAGAVRVVELIDRCRTSVLVHCSDGWDRTSQLTSIAMLLMDPFYRTVRGFQILIEKEWLAFGHKFQQRCGHGDKKHGDEQRSPIFVQFIDVVWQLTQQFPSAFQFNNCFLITVLDHLYSCLYGTFLCNSDKQRTEVRQRTVSLWSHVNDQSDEFLNPLFAPSPSVLYPVAAMHRMQLWTGYYARWNPRMRPQEDIHSCVLDLHRACRQLEMQVQVLEGELSRLIVQPSQQAETKLGLRGRASANVCLRSQAGISVSAKPLNSGPT